MYSPMTFWINRCNWHLDCLGKAFIKHAVIVAQVEMSLTLIWSASHSKRPTCIARSVKTKEDGQCSKLNSTFLAFIDKIQLTWVMQKKDKNTLAGSQQSIYLRLNKNNTRKSSGSCLCIYVLKLLCVLCYADHFDLTFYLSWRHVCLIVFSSTFSTHGLLATPNQQSVVVDTF